MHWQDRISDWLSKFFQFNKIEETKPDPLIAEIEAKGYKYDSGNDWYERTWTTESEPKESIREVYQQLESGDWNQLMIGYGDNIFYEEKVEKKSLEVTD
tara:strand:+ start:3695 stop:3991 length:297 start_codon:yes stop_codon:yes gene_type:complete